VHNQIHTRQRRLPIRLRGECTDHNSLSFARDASRFASDRRSKLKLRTVSQL
jgi:hypothetical protein